MEFQKLDLTNSTYVPIAVIEDYSSLIWTERYRLAGDFQLKTPEVDATRALLPLRSLVTVADSVEAAFVEDHLIEKDPDGEVTLTVSGRTFESFLENRVSRQDGQEPLYIRGTGGIQDSSRTWEYTPSTAHSLAWNYIRAKTEIAGQLYGQTIPNFKVFYDAFIDTLGLPTREYKIKPGELYEQVLEILAMDDLGLRSVRPEAGNNPEMQILIYAGHDLTDTVVLSTSAGHFESTSYLWSIRDHKNMAHAFSYYGFKATSNVSTAFGVGLNRRIGYVDATDIKSASGVNDNNALTARGATYLKRHPLATIFDGEVSSTIPYEYPWDYQLGDTIRVVGDYGVKQDMQVTEFTRVQDKEGERGYPTLTVPGTTAT